MLLHNLNGEDLMALSLPLYLVAFLLIYFWGIQSTDNPVQVLSKNLLDTLHIAYLAGGSKRASHTALIGIFEANLGHADQQEKIIQNLSPTLAPSLRHYKFALPGLITIKDFEESFAGSDFQLNGELTGYGLLQTDEQIRNRYIGSACILAVPILLAVFGLFEISTRVSLRGMFTLQSMLISAGIYIIQHGRLRTRYGNEVLKQLRRKYARVMQAPLPDQVPLAFALTGKTSILYGKAYYADFTQPSGLQTDLNRIVRRDITG